MEQQEQVEWDDVNRLLQYHGFKPVFFADPVENKNHSDLVLLDKKSAGEVRTTLRTMLTDSERRQALIQELVKSNNQLKEEVQQHMSRAAQQSQRAMELEGLLDEVKTRVQDVEDRYLGKAAQQHSHTLQLLQEKQDAQKRCHVLEQKLSKQKEEAAQLQRKLYFTIKEEEQRRFARQNETFQNICKKVSVQSSATDQQSLKGESQGSKMSDPTRAKKTPVSVTPSVKTILKAYRDQQKESKSEVEELKKEVENLKKELETRLPKEDNTTEISENTGDHSREARLCNLLNEISAVVMDPTAPLRRLHRQKPSAATDLEPADFHALLPTLEAWAQQLRLLKDLQRSLNKLSARLMPWQLCEGVHNAAEAVAKVEDMMLLVDTMLETTSTDDQKALRSPTPHTLGSMVSHFQKLFDVTSLSGVYPRMNKVYARLGEMTNAMKNLRDVLDLDSRVSPAEVVNQVSRLVSSAEHTAGLCNVLGDADVDSIVTKVKQHEEFFPAFHALVTEILQTLGVSHLDNILPALRDLKQVKQ